MSIDELKYKESKLRECFMKKLDELDVDGTNDYCTIKDIKTYGALWHYAHQLLMAEANKEEEKRSTVTTADTMNIQTTGLKMTGGK